MNDLVNYELSSDEELEHNGKPKNEKIQETALYMTPTDKEMTYNMPYNLTNKPLVGPQNPLSNNRLTNQNVLTGTRSQIRILGHIEKTFINPQEFNLQESNFRSLGYTKDPTEFTQDKEGKLGGGINGTGFVGDIDKAIKNNGAFVSDNKAKLKNNQSRGARIKKNDATILEGEDAYRGPWGGYEGDMEPSQIEGWRKKVKVDGEIELPEELQEEEVEKLPLVDIRDEYTEFYGIEERDYLGRSYLNVPTDLDINLKKEFGSFKCFHPKKLVHTFLSPPQHTGKKGVNPNQHINCIRFIPNSGHIFISGGGDTQIKLFDIYHNRKMLRIFNGHKKAIRDLQFINDGTQFISASYDRLIKLWDTETGKCLHAYTNGKQPYSIATNPNPAQRSQFLVGSSNKKILQFDIRTDTLIQSYNEHLAPVHTVTYIEGGKQFVSTSEDKTIRVWDVGIPISSRYLSDPNMKSIIATYKHPTLPLILGQCLDNRLLTYTTTDKLRLNKKKIFRGHFVANNPCKPTMSGDARYVFSGDSIGHIWCWDFNECKFINKIKAHDSVVVDLQFHPQETSKILSCGYDGTIKYWD